MIIKCICGKDLYDLDESMSRFRRNIFLSNLLDEGKIFRWRHWFKTKIPLIFTHEDIYFCEECWNKIWEKLDGKSHRKEFFKYKTKSDKINNKDE